MGDVAGDSRFMQETRFCIGFDRRAPLRLPASHQDEYPAADCGLRSAFGFIHRAHAAFG
jgi:hypothetical protein